MFKLRVLLQSKVVIELVFFKEMINMTETETETDTKTKTRIKITTILKLDSLY